MNKYAGVVADLLAEQNARQIDMRGQVMARASVLNKQGAVDPKQLKMGIDVESEHTSNPKVKKKIALDHLAEIPDYYTRLNKMEREAKMTKEGAYIEKVALKASTVASFLNKAKLNALATADSAQISARLGNFGAARRHLQKAKRYIGQVYNGARIVAESPQYNSKFKPEAFDKAIANFTEAIMRKTSKNPDMTGFMMKNVPGRN